MSDKMVTTNKEHNCIGCQVVIPKGANVLTATRMVASSDEAPAKKMTVRFCRACLCVLDGNRALQREAKQVLYPGIISGEYNAEFQEALERTAALEVGDDSTRSVEDEDEPDAPQADPDAPPAEPEEPAEDPASDTEAPEGDAEAIGEPPAEDDETPEEVPAPEEVPGVNVAEFDNALRDALRCDVAVRRLTADGCAAVYVSVPTVEAAPLSAIVELDGKSYKATRTEVLTGTAQFKARYVIGLVQA